MTTSTVNADNGGEQQDDEYFQSYFDCSVHELMIKDKPRTDGYLKSIVENAHVFKDKIVMDVGAGTGILSLFAAKYGGAKKVYAVEASPMANFTKLFVEHNGLQDVIEVIHGRVEEIVLPVEKVDIIISEWMGFYLLHEGMLDSVLYARDKYLNQDGLLFPQKAIIYMSPCEMNNLYKEKVNFWEDVYGFDMSAIMSMAMYEISLKPKVDIISPSQLLLKNPIVVKELDLGKITVDDLKYIDCECHITLDNITDEEAQTHVHGFCVWFDVVFEPNKVILSTSPAAPPTHWKQTIIMLPQAMTIPASKKIPKTTLVMTPSDENPRHYDLSLDIPDAFKEDFEDDEMDLKDIIMNQYAAEMEDVDEEQEEQE
ncbi:predicted protein [Naegleria gruberi]|uniref:type I protein arginine methyltransferase n=1 Tax=Naegleria gruberi TaxID=5762 RepID=D2V9J8_NAEGR|nr:uncharacterized protein NAEGRDRAFT_32151 [Naegleria gruberi]EFC46475.1 predicted protein [Naegleria gruberi]|eukprot:XP_002679219.1 predicted protein [Naegleria gruberi strain NEG-M]